MKKQFSILALSILLFTFGANAQHSQTADKTQKSEKAVTKAHPAFQKQLEAVYKANLKLNEAFVTSDAGKVKAAVKPVKDAVLKVDMKLLDGQAHQDWMAYSKEMNQRLTQIENADNIKEQRKHFSPYNDALYNSIKAFGIGEETYFQHCPMALNNEGASWLSNSKEIRNPYYGDKMLKCGVIKETL
jgi:Cu(I)/Ag(I) efflux system membrane fusion protein